MSEAGPRIDCRVCCDRRHCPVPAIVQGTSPRQEDRGAPLVAAAAIVFLLPLATAIAAAFLGSRFAAPRPESLALWQVGGAGCGLVVGVVVARLLTVLGQRHGGHP